MGVVIIGNDSGVVSFYDTKEFLDALKVSKALSGGYETPVMVNYKTVRVERSDPNNYNLPVADTLTLESYGVELDNGDRLRFQFEFHPIKKQWYMLNKVNINGEAVLL
jgi:hypothetical protein